MDLQSRLDAYPRLAFAAYPTPLEYLSGLSKQLGRALYIKRDDAIGPMFGGNKTRKLEYDLAYAQQIKARKVVTFGGLQSNHARLTAATALRCGMEPHLFYFARRPKEPKGNLLLNELLGARMHFIPFGGGGDGSMTLEATMRLVKLIAFAVVGPHYFIPVGGHSWRAALGYARAACELDEQARAKGIQNARVVVAGGTGGTLAGLMAGLHLCNSSLQLVGIDIGKLWKAFPASIAHLANHVSAALGGAERFLAQTVPLIERTYVGAAYAAITRESLDAIQLLARTEGIFLDPVYTGKAFAGLLDLIRRGELGSDQPIIFLHTGGIPALFALDPKMFADLV